MAQPTRPQNQKGPLEHGRGLQAADGARAVRPAVGGDCEALPGEDGQCHQKQVVRQRPQEEQGAREAGPLPRSSRGGGVAGGFRVSDVCGKTDVFRGVGGAGGRGGLVVFEAAGHRQGRGGRRLLDGGGGHGRMLQDHRRGPRQAPPQDVLRPRLPLPPLGRPPRPRRAPPVGQDEARAEPVPHPPRRPPRRCGHLAPLPRGRRRHAPLQGRRRPQHQV
mmetsp:Transcript_33822/g.85522  ORF Transcript_33822/g.85522 Transcript_33822/m.85522 type:complete len:219 (-) Transcript_33822:80-736(-)